jgi:hypothetical protein
MMHRGGEPGQQKACGATKKQEKSAVEWIMEKEKWAMASSCEAG